MYLNKNSFWWRMVAYGLIILLGYVLFSAVWGAAGGLVVGGSVMRDPVFVRQLKDVVGEKPSKYDRDVWSKLPEEKKAALYRLTRQRLKAVNWLPIHLITNLVTFAVLGFAFGFFLKNFRFSLIIPLTLAPATLMTLGSATFGGESRYLTIVLGVVVQISAVYAFSYWGLMVRSKKDTPSADQLSDK